MHQLPIRDPSAIRRVLARAVDYYGSRRKAAGAFGVEPSTFQRLARGTTSKRISSANYDLIRAALAADPLGITDGWDWSLLQDEFTGAVLTWEARQAAALYRSWVDHESRRLYRKVFGVVRLLRRKREYWQYVKRFQKRMGRAYDPTRKRRVWIAIYRALEPLADADLTWGVERSWQELDERGELAQFLNASLRREEIILSRAPDKERLATLVVSDAMLADLADPE